MFVTTAQYKHPLSDVLGDAQATVWNAVGVELLMPWFLVEVLDKSSDVQDGPVLRTILLSQAQDVLNIAHLCVRPPVALLSVGLMSPDASNRPGGWTMHPLSGIWTATAPRDHGMRIPVFEKSEGEFYVEPLFGTPVEDLHSWSLVAKFESQAPAFRT